jgi:hypothetical protein
MLKRLDTTIYNKPSVLLILFAICFSAVTMDMWRNWHSLAKNDDNFKWDIAGYYSYLPAFFVCDDQSTDCIEMRYKYTLIDAPLGGKITKGTYGMALMYSPFFALGYKMAVNTNQPLDGFSEPFATALHWGSILYAILGLILLRNLLIRFYSEKVTAITLAIIFFGTNLFYYTLSESEMTHGYLFFLYSAFLLTSYHWYQKPNFKKTILLGLIIGVITLIRPTEIMLSFLFLFIATKPGETLQNRFNFIFKNYLHLLVIVLVSILIWIPQLLFWKVHTGNYLFFSYPGERFYWSDPQILNILFSYRKGWLVYSPLLILAFVGFFFMKKEMKLLRNCILVLTLLNIYVLSCWWDWFFGGGFGGRGFVQHYSYLSFPIAALVAFLLEKLDKVALKNILALSFYVIIFSGICLNIGQSYQYVQGMIHFNSMTKKTYWHVFGRYKISGPAERDYWQSLSAPNYEKLKSGEQRDQ